MLPAEIITAFGIALRRNVRRIKRYDRVRGEDTKSLSDCREEQES
jgi:hypothetical protein